MVEHAAIKCNCGNPGCMFCDGGLFGCSVCGCFEGATTTECPGRKTTSEESDLIYNGKLDYKDGKWINQPSRFCPGGNRISEEVEEFIKDRLSSPNSVFIVDETFFIR